MPAQPSSQVEPPRVAILLATYNGAGFLAAQLASIAAQTHPNWHVYWRDDGSTDATCAIMDHWALRDHVTSLPGGQRLGALEGFMALLHQAEAADYMAFCDQDDVWLPNKLTRAIAALSGQVGAALYGGRQILVDDDLRPMGLSPLPARPLGFRNALVQNVITGCTTVLNTAARDLILAAPPPPAGSFHDWWAYLVVSGADGVVLFDPEPALWYRQHAGNLVGANAGVWQRAVRALGRGGAPFMRQLNAHLAQLARDPGLTPQHAGIVRQLGGFSQASVWRRWAALRRAGLYRQTRLEDLLLYLWVALWRG